MPQDALRSSMLTVRLNTVQSFFRNSCFSSPRMLRRKVTMEFRPFTRHNFKNSAVYIVAVSACCQELPVI